MVTVGFYYLLFSIIALVVWTDSAYPFVLISTVLAVLFKCKLDDLMERMGTVKSNALLRFLDLGGLLQQFAYLIIVVLTAPISILEYLGCCDCWNCHKRFFGGEHHILPGRENLTDVQIGQFVGDINQSDTGYCFLRVLVEEDREKFVTKLTDKDMLEIYQRRAIRIDLWLTIMNSIDLTSNYTVYRRAYYGENVGRDRISSRLTNFVVPLWYFVHKNVPVARQTIMDDLMTAFNRLSVTTRSSTICILLDDNHMCNFCINRRRESNGILFQLSKWSNERYIVADEFYGSNNYTI